ncbi:MAG TPA: hypothetical protein VI942_12455 [Thermoanaerobaculia bacterium]|nr:hypothetical protein [Thermoanaerobaculia bacterium]
MDRSERGLEQAYWALRVGLGGAAFVAGLDKFFGYLAMWEMYLAPWAAGALPFSSGTFFRVVGVVEMAAGAMVLTRWTRLGAYVVAAWLAAIAVQLVTTGSFYDLAVRDLGLAIAAFALAKLSEWRAARGVAAAA